jgi:dihydrofolate synthase/folylpolyglutamate synthase
MYTEAREYLNGITKYGSVLGLTNIKELLKRLGNPQNDLTFVHIAGTNGKGSTLAFISTILKTAGYRTGRYLSPSVFSYREKMQANEKYITKALLTKLTFLIKDAIDDMLLEGFSHPTIFEVETVLAFLYFKQEKCDIVVLETGLGGLLDATNVVENTIAAVLTAISRDHVEFLGNTIEEITKNKVGIIKRDSIVVTTNQEPDASKVIEEHCLKHKNECILADYKIAENISYQNLKINFDYNESKNIEINLAGSYQIQNAILAIETIKALRKKGYQISELAMREGLKQTKWAGRFTKICNDPVMIIDGAHNEAAARQLTDTIRCYFKSKKLMFVIGVLADKEYEKIIELTSSLAWKILTITTPNHVRSMKGEELAEIVRKYHSNVEYMPTIKAAVDCCMKNKNQVDAIIAFGSLSYLGEFENEVKALKGGN